MIILDSTKNFDYTQISIVLISGLFSLLVAFITARLTRRNEIVKIKEEQKNINHKLNYDLKQMLITIESGNYRTLYEKKLAALKRIKEIQFRTLESNSEEYDSVERYMSEFPFKELLENMHNLIIEYSYLFNEEIVDSLKSIYHDTDFTKNNYDPESSDWLEYSERIFKKFHNLVSLITDDLNIDLKSIEKKILKPSL